MDCAHAPRVDGQPLDEIQTRVMAVGQYVVGLSNRPEIRALVLPL